MRIAFILLFFPACLCGQLRTNHKPLNYKCAEHAGSPVITGNSINYPLKGGDTITITGNFEEISFQQMDGNGKEIVIDARGALQTSPVNFHQPEWFDLHYVKLLGLKSYNWNGTIKSSYYINNFTFESCQFINPLGEYKNQPVIQFDNASYSQMIFTGNKKQTFFNNKITKCRIDGFGK